MSDQLADSNAGGRRVLEWVQKCLTAGQVGYRPGLTGNLHGLGLADVAQALWSAELPATEWAQERWLICGHNVDGIRIDVLVSVPVNRGITLLRAWRRDSDSDSDRPQPGWKPQRT
jgi:hypothetical protein